MSEPLSNVNTPLSYKLGIYRKEAHDPRLCIPEDWKGYNKCVRDLDQLSPDAQKLADILESLFYAHDKQKQTVRGNAEMVAQEIINKMSEWIKR